MPFSSLKNPEELARAERILNVVWERITDSGLVSGDKSEYVQLAYLVANVLHTSQDDRELVRRICERVEVKGL